MNKPGREFAPNPNVKRGSIDQIRNGYFSRLPERVPVEKFFKNCTYYGWTMLPPDRKGKAVVPDNDCDAPAVGCLIEETGPNNISPNDVLFFPRCEEHSQRDSSKGVWVEYAEEGKTKVQ